MTVGGALDRAAETLGGRGVPDPGVDAALLLGHVLGRSRTELQVGRSEVLAPAEEAAFRALVDRRARREPLAYVLGSWGFRRLTLSVDPRVLVPRPETEIVVERCLGLLRGLDEPAVLDVGTGSGAIALALADEHPGARVTAVDSSPEALAVATENAARLGLTVRLLVHDLANGLPGGPYDLVVANLPYVLPAEVEKLAPEVRDWEPRGALVDRGQTGAVAGAATRALVHGGWLVLETHQDDARRVAGLLEADYDPVRITRDLAGRERVVEARWPR
jgi:release factor glutamine methyltransferase